MNVNENIDSLRRTRQLIDQVPHRLVSDPVYRPDELGQGIGVNLAIGATKIVVGWSGLLPAVFSPPVVASGVGNLKAAALHGNGVLEKNNLGKVVRVATRATRFFP